MLAFLARWIDSHHLKRPILETEGRGGVVGHLVVLKVVKDSTRPYAVQYIAAKGQS